MFKKFVFVAVAMVMAANSVMAGDDITSMLANLDGAKDKSAQVEDADLLGQKDVDALLGEDKKDGEDAIAACFRRHGGYIGHGGFGSYGSFGGYHNNWYSTCYSYNYCAPSYSYTYTPVTYCYTPVTYSCYTPCYTSYWGCW